VLIEIPKRLVEKKKNEFFSRQGLNDDDGMGFCSNNGKNEIKTYDLN